VTAPVSHQKQPEQTKTNTIEIERKPSKINEPGRHSAAHNNLVAGSNPAGPPHLMIRQRSRAPVVTRQSDFPFTVPPWRQAASCENGEKLFFVK
jgi:hypothetical protein